MFKVGDIVIPIGSSYDRSLTGRIVKIYYEMNTARHVAYGVKFGQTTISMYRREFTLFIEPNNVLKDLVCSK